MRIIIVIYYVEYEGNERVKVTKQNKNQVGEFIFNVKYDGERRKQASDTTIVRCEEQEDICLSELIVQSKYD